MFIAIYRGKFTQRGTFTHGRLYPAKPEVDDPSVVECDRFLVYDDRNHPVWIQTDWGMFDFPEKGYAAVVQAFGAYALGDVVVILDLSDGEFFSVEGCGYMRADHFELLDEAMLDAGAVAYDRQSCRWIQIEAVDYNTGTVLANGVGRNIVDLRFAVSGGDLVLSPLVRCSCKCQDGLTEGKIYRVRGVSPEGWLEVENDGGVEEAYPTTCFVLA